ncbi:MAG: VIT family protein [Planctomycetes bacterium]|nr:VIT family protein [Planctomycetota bacterium]
MADDSAAAAPKRILEPIERISEVLFGLIMVLTFTGSLSAAEAGQGEIRTMLYGALGCNLAWGLIDGIMYLMGCLSERAGGLRRLRAARQAADAATAHQVIAGALPPVVAAALRPEDFERVRQHLRQLPEPPRYPALQSRDALGAVAVLLWVFCCTLPVVLPFVFLREANVALRASNAVAIVLLFVTGAAFGRVAGLRAWLTGTAMVLLGVVLVALTIALGG